MKILITTDWYKPIINGVVTSVLNLKQELEERGHEVKVLTLSRTYASYEKAGVYYMKSVNLEKIYPNVRAVLPHTEKLVRELVQWKPDIVHSQCEFMTFPFAVKISRKCGSPLIHTYHTVYEDYIHYLPGKFSEYRAGAALEKKAVAQFSRNVLKKADQVIVPTGKVERILGNYRVETPVAVIPTGIQLQRFCKDLSEKEKQDLKKKWGIAPENQVLVSVGRLAKEKNLEELLRFFAKLGKEEGNEHLTFLIAGDGPDRERLEHLVQKLEIQEHTVFTGMIEPEAVGKYYQLGDVFVCASNSETQGITYMEAMASGLPALCRKDACLNQVVTDGYNGFQYDSYAYFKMHLEYLLEKKSRRSQMGECARETAYRYSTWNFCTMVERLYKEVLVRQKAAEMSGRFLAVWGRKNILRRGV